MTVGMSGMKTEKELSSPESGRGRLQEILNKRTQEYEHTRKDQAERNRRDFPISSGLLEAARSDFGRDCRMVWVNDGGREIGIRSEGVQPVIFDKQKRKVK